MPNRAVRIMKVMLLGSSLGGLTLMGQNTGPTLTLQDAEALALKNHPQVLASQAVYLQADQLTTQSKSAYFPALNGAITGTQANAGSRLGAGLLNDPSLFTHFGAGLTLSQLVTDSGRTPNLVAEARLHAQASRQDYRTSRYDVILGVDQAYYEVLLAQQLVRVAHETVNTRQTAVDQASELYRNGLKSQVDLSFAQVNLSDAKLMLIRAQDRLAVSYATLAQSLGTQDAITYELTEPQAAPAPPQTDNPLIDQAFKNRPELASARLQREADQKLVYAERDLKRPTVSLLAVGGTLPYIVGGNANSNIPKEYEAAGLNVQIPIFNGHLYSARREAAEYQLQATDQRVRAVQERIARDVRAALERAKTTFQAIATADELLQQANLALSLEQGRYKIGLDSIVELTQAQLAQTRAEVESVSAKYDYQEAYAALQYTLGMLP
jgi:outer membrane protein